MPIALDIRPTYLLLALLQVSKWIGYGFTGVALVAILRRAGADLTEISMLMGVGFLFMFKFLWAPLVDRWRVFGLPTYKGWYLLAQALMALSLAPLFWNQPPQDVHTILVCLVISSVAATFRDIAMDGLAVKILRADERATANGWMSAGFMLGMVLGGGVLLMLYDSIGWAGAVWILVLGTLLPLPLVALFSEPDIGAAQTPANRPAMWAALLAFFKLPGNRQWAGLIVLMSMAGITGPSLLVLMLVDNGWPLTRVGGITNVAGPLLAAALSLAAGYVFARLSRRTAIVAIMLLGAGFSFAKMPIASNSYPEAVTIVVVILAVIVASWTNIVQKIVVTDKAAGSADFGTNFTLQGSLNQVGSNLAMVLAPLLAKQIGYAYVVMIGGLIGLLAAALLSRYRHL
jgi:MFS family permease